MFSQVVVKECVLENLVMDLNRNLQGKIWEDFNYPGEISPPVNRP